VESECKRRAVYSLIPERTAFWKMTTPLMSASEGIGRVLGNKGCISEASGTGLKAVMHYRALYPPFNYSSPVYFGRLIECEKPTTRRQIVGQAGICPYLAETAAKVRRCYLPRGLLSRRGAELAPISSSANSLYYHIAIPELLAGSAGFRLWMEVVRRTSWPPL